MKGMDEEKHLSHFLMLANWFEKMVNCLNALFHIYSMHAFGL